MLTCREITTLALNPRSVKPGDLGLCPLWNSVPAWLERISAVEETVKLFSSLPVRAQQRGKGLVRDQVRDGSGSSGLGSGKSAHPLLQW